MKIGLVIPANLKYSPYVKYYIDIFRTEGIQFKTMIWDKTGLTEEADYIFSYQSSDLDRKRIMIGHYLFARQCRHYIKREHIDHLIIFTIAPLYFLGYRFLKQFEGKIIIDIRDDSPFRRRFPKKLKNISTLAENVVVSSPYYSAWVSKESFICHNADLNLIEKYKEGFCKDSFSNHVSIAYAGMMIEEQINIKAIQKLANKEEFKLVFIGRDNEGKEKIKKYVKEHGVHNVSFIGEYKKDDIIDLYRTNGDIVNILRENTLINKNALPNKLYEAVISNLPVVVYEHNAAIANYVSKYGLGILLNEQDDLEEQLGRKIKEFDFVKYQNGRQEFLQLVLNDYAKFKELLVQFSKKQ